MNYRIINGYSISELEKNVVKLMELGFIPIGSFKIQGRPSVQGTTYYQTMYKPSEK